MSVVQVWDERDRLAALYETAVLDTAPESAFDALVALAAQLFGTPMAALTLVDEDRQWFKSRIGLPHAGTSRSESVCDVVVRGNRSVVVPDALADPRFRLLPGVLAGGFRSYAGVPVTTRDGLPLGTLCVLDVEVRQFDPARITMLEQLALLAGDQLELRRRDTAAGLDPRRMVEMLASVRRALHQDELVVFYQPVVDLGSGRVVAVEALVRWQHPTEGLLPPLEFLAVAEAAGMGALLDRWVLRRAATALRDWRAAGAAGSDLTLAVNIGLRAGTGVVWAQQQLEVLAEVGLAPEHVTFEISERSIATLPASAHDALQVLRDAGAGIALDDLGTGTSSLARVLDVPATSVKIDRSFVTDLGRDPRRDAVVAAMCRLGVELGLDVVAEGVEDHATAARLAAMGATQAQGYVFSRPVPQAEVPALLRADRAPVPAATGDQVCSV